MVKSRVRGWGWGSRGRAVRMTPALKNRLSPLHPLTGQEGRARAWVAVLVSLEETTPRFCSGSWSTTIWTWTRFWTCLISSPVSRCPRCPVSRMTSAQWQEVTWVEAPWRGTGEEDWRAPLYPTTSLWTWAAAAHRLRYTLINFINNCSVIFFKDICASIGDLVELWGGNHPV